MRGVFLRALVRVLLASSAAGAAPLGAQGNRSLRFGPDSCGPADPAYLRVANETGGLPMFLQPSEATKAMHLVRESIVNNAVTLLWATGTLDGSPREFSVPVDSTAERVTFSVSVDTKGSSMAVMRPTGTEVTPEKAGAETTELNCGRMVTLAAPETGNWRVRLAGHGRYWFEAKAKSEIFFVGVEFVQPGGRPGHEGLFRIAGQPLSGSPATLQVNLSGPFETASFKLVSEEGNLLQPLRMAVESSGSDEKEFLGKFELPRQPFRVAVSGEDSKHRPYQRFFHTLFHAETVEVVPSRPFDDLPAGKTTPVTFKVRNVGSPATFHIVATDGQRFVSRVEPRELSLTTGESGTVSVDLTVPLDTPVGTGLDLTVTATSTVPPATTNGASQHLSVFVTQSLRPHVQPVRR